MKFPILSWNIRQGGGSRIHALCHAIVTLNPLIVQMSEYRNNAAGNTISAILKQKGFQYILTSTADKNTNTTAIFSKLPLKPLRYDGMSMEYSSNVLTAQFDAFDLTGLYFPHKKKHALFNILLERSTMDKPQIFMGDFNSGINGLDQLGNSFWYEGDMKLLTHNGMADAFRHLHGNVLEYSWYSHRGNGYRYDHIYISKQLIPVLKTCQYIHSWREQGLSDHSPMVIELGG